MNKQYGGWALFGLACFILVFFSTYKLSEAPRIWYDEGYYTQTAENLMLYGQQALQVAPVEFASASTITGGYPLVAPVALSYKLFGIGVLQGRSVMVLFILGFFLAAVFLSKLLYGVRFALWSAFLIASFPMLYGVGKSVLGEVPGLMFLFLTLISLVYLQRSGYRSLYAYVTSGAATGLCVATKPIFILLLPALAIVLFLYRRSILVRSSGVALAILAFISTFIPWFLLQFGTQDSVANVLTFYANPYEISDLVGTALKNLLLFVTEITPIYALIVFVLVACSLFIRRKYGESISPPEVVCFIFVVLVMLAFLRLPGWYRYLFPAIMAGLPLVPYALWRTWAWICSRYAIRPLALGLPWLVLSLIIIGQIYQTANSSFVATYYTSHMTRELTAALTALPNDASFFVYNAPEVVILLSSQNYYQYIKPHETIGILGTDSLRFIASGTADYIIVNTGTVFDVDISKYKEEQKVNRYTILKRKNL